MLCGYCKVRAELKYRSHRAVGLRNEEFAAVVLRKVHRCSFEGNPVIDTFGCIKNTIKVSAGHYVDLASPDPETIDIKSIAAALSKTCRFGGHCPKYYTVAEHCFHAVGLAAQDQLGGDVLRAILLHDATEAYVGDVVKPLKAMLPEYQIIESNIEQAVATRFNVDFIRHNDLIKRYDRLMLKAEKIQMWPDDREEWFGFAGLPTRVVNFQYWHPEMAEEQFLKLAAALEL